MVPPDPMPNSEVKRRSADGSVGSPHARVGNCQASKKAKGPVERQGLLLYLLFTHKHYHPDEDQLSGHVERCAATKSCKTPNIRTIVIKKATCGVNAGHLR